VDPAPELEAFARDVIEIFMTQNAEQFLDSFSKQPGTLCIGTEYDEWWRGRDVISAAFSVQLDEMSPFTIAIDEVEGWQEGTIGWASFRGSIDVADGDSSQVRGTLVWRKEGPYWKIVTFHFSGTKSNEEILGRSLTTAFDELIELVHDEPPPLAAASADGSVTIVFTDIEGSTAFVESLGEEDWSSMLAWHDLVTTGQTKTFGGIVVKGLGDGFMLAFPSPGAATACVIAMQHALDPGWEGVPVPVRIGLHCGNAREESGDLFGRTVIIAARIASAAAGREILISQDVQQALSGAFPLGEPETLRLKGLSGTYTLFPVLT
jgi:class 3 adenylate cyclase